MTKEKEGLTTLETIIIPDGKYCQDRRVNCYKICYWLSDGRKLISEGEERAFSKKEAKKIERNIWKIFSYAH